MEHIRNKYFWFVFPYFLLTGVTYIWGYWGTFGINVFEYASLNELVMASLIPLLSIAVFFVIGVSIGSYTSHTDKKTIADKNPNKMSFMDWIMFLLFFVPQVVMFVITEKESLRWIIGLIFLSFFISILVIKSDFLHEHLPKKTRGLIIFLFFGFIFLSFAAGKENALKILNNENYKSFSHKNMEFKFIGHIRDKNFFIDMDNKNILILHEEEVRSLTLTKHKISVPIF